jgi:PPOX class probable F420-dependent enzyme
MATSSKSAITKFTDFFYEWMRHKDAWSVADAEPTTGFTSLAGHKYAVLITYRKDGRGVPSPVWFGRDERDRVYFDTEEAAGKVKRIRNHPEVRLAPCNLRGKPLGPPAVGIARVLDPAESEYAEHIIAANYGETAGIARLCRGATEALTEQANVGPRMLSSSGSTLATVAAYESGRSRSGSRLSPRLE